MSEEPQGREPSPAPPERPEATSRLVDWATETFLGDEQQARKWLEGGNLKRDSEFIKRELGDRIP